MDGIPDSKSLSTAFISFNNMYKITNSGTDDPTKNWDCDIVNNPDPCCFGSYAAEVSGVAQNLMLPYYYGAHQGSSAPFFMNSEIATGSGAVPDIEGAYNGKLSTWVNNVRFYRLGYYGVTIQVDAPALANQGELVSTQYSVPSQRMSMACQTGPGYPYILRDVAMIPFQGCVTFDQAVNNPQVYRGHAIDGVYIPLRLDEDFKFRNADSTQLTHSDWDAELNADRKSVV